MGSVRYFACTKDFSFMLDPPGGFWAGPSMRGGGGGWVLLGFFAIDSQLGGVLGLGKGWSRWLRLIKMECCI